MDEIFLDDYDPRNAIGFVPGGPRPMLGLTRPLITRRPGAFAPVQAVPQPRPVYYPLPASYPAPAGYPVPTGYPVPGVPYYGMPASKLGRKLADLTVGDLAPLIALGIIALRPLPVPPSDEGHEANVVNQTKYLGGLADHFRADQQFRAIGELVGTLFR